MRRRPPQPAEGVPLSRRGLLAAGSGALLVLSGCGGSSPGPVTGSSAISDAPTGPVGLETRLRARPVTVQLGGATVETWAYDARVGGPELRLRAGQRLRAVLENALSQETTIHWHGIRLRNPMDGLPGITQPPVKPGGSFIYDFVVPDPGTYFFHPHVALQLDRGLYAPLVVEDPHEPLVYDAEAVLVLDDWLDGVAGTPEDALTRLASRASGAGMQGMSGMPGMDGMGGSSSMPGDRAGVLGGDLAYPLHLINGRPPADRLSVRARAGSRIRLRIVNAASDTAYRFAVGGHRLRVTHADGWPVEPVEVHALVIGMGERYDVLVEPRSGAWPIVARAEGKQGAAVAVLRTRDATGAAPPMSAAPRELGGTLLDDRSLAPTAAARLREGTPDRTIRLALTGGMMSYDWGVDGRRYPDTPTIELHEGERVRVELENQTMMWHPIHIHGHTTALQPTGVRRDTIKVLPHETVAFDLYADNPGRWMLHCHNTYHLARGMAVDVRYVT